MTKTRRYATLVAIAALVNGSIAPWLEAQSAAQPATTQPATVPATAAPAPSAATAAVADPDGGWPRDLETPTGGALRLFQPQVASWDGQTHMVLYAAAAYVPTGAAKPMLGTVKIEADSSVAVDERLVNFPQIKLTESNFPGMPNEQLREVVAQIEREVPVGGLVLGLDRVLARLDKSQIIPKNQDGVKADPPNVFYSTTAAVLVNLDGDPIWSPIKDNDLKFVVNTNWDILQDATSKDLFLRYNTSWLTATDIKGPWKLTTKLPASFSTLPTDGNWNEVKAAVPPRPATGATPKVFVSTTPAELILLQGAPNYLTVPGAALLWISNTDADLFRVGRSGPIYYLVSGRWFTATDFAGPWTFATEKLPAEFKKIPVSHPRSRVLASVPGTDQAAEAVLLAQIPQTARVNKKGLTPPTVEYDGTPEFQPIDETKVARAVNTDKDIIKVGDLYYMCFQGVWFMGRSPNGPWEVTGSVPGEIYEIPTSSPAYNVTQVTVVEDDDDAVVYATAAAYSGMMIAWGCAVWGTGWYYPPYAYYGGFYPIYRPYYPTYGYHASYNPWTGTYSRGVAAYGPYGGAGVGAKYNPRTGTYARGAAAWGPYGARGYAGAYNPRTGASAATRQGSSVYGSWGQTAVQRGDQWATTSRVTNRATGATTRGTQTSSGAAAVTRNGVVNNSGVVRTADGDIYAGRDGNVYKKGTDGSWQKHDGGNWNHVEPTQAQRDQAQQRAQQAGTGNRGLDSATAGQLNRDSAARAEGAQRSRDAGSTRSTGGSSSYRPSTGARSMPRGGGGRRR